MDQALFEALGKAAGIGGLALGVFLLIFRSVIRKNIFPKLPDESAYRLIRLILVLTFLIAAFGIGAWVYLGTRPTSSHGAVNESEVEESLEQVGGTGWVLLGNYDFDKGGWTFGPFFDFVRGEHPNKNELPTVGTSIKLTEV